MEVVAHFLPCNMNMIPQGMTTNQNDNRKHSQNQEKNLKTDQLQLVGMLCCEDVTIVTIKICGSLITMVKLP